MRVCVCVLGNPSSAIHLLGLKDHQRSAKQSAKSPPSQQMPFNLLQLVGVISQTAHAHTQKYVSTVETCTTIRYDATSPPTTTTLAIKVQIKTARRRAVVPLRSTRVDFVGPCCVRVLFFYFNGSVNKSRNLN